jgi:ABC-type polar amino acid transport system ATPase subunit
MTKAQAKSEALKVFKFVGLTDKMYDMPQTLSGGQKQRVAIARALIMNPKVLLLDEPTSALDPELIQEVLKVIRMLAKKKITMVIVTHQIDFAKEVADRIVFMENGKIVEEGTPKAILETPKKARTKEFLQSIL